MDTLAALLDEGQCEDCLVHFGGCSVLGGDEEAVRQRVRTFVTLARVNERIQSTWFDVITAERPPGTYAVRAVGFDDFPGDPSTIEWAATERFERGCTAYLLQCGDDRDCRR